MIKRNVFIGCSHTIGYQFNKVAMKPLLWTGNNYAEIYSNMNSKHGIIYSCAGASNTKYPLWLSNIFKMYNNIDTVYIQSTYWDRFPIGFSKNLDMGLEYSADTFLKKCHSDGLIDRYTDTNLVGDRFEYILKPAAPDYTPFKGYTTNGNHPEPDLKILNYEYIYTKIYHELTCHLQYEQYCKDLLIIDYLCKKNNATCVVWRINDRCILPKNVELFAELENTKIELQSARSFLINEQYGDIETQTVDGEHYTLDVHKKIAEMFIPSLTVAHI